MPSSSLASLEAPPRVAPRGRPPAWAALALLLVVIAAFHLLTLRGGIKFSNGDTPMYIRHAKNLVEGRPYAEVGYVQNPRYAMHPQAYPPGYPLLLAPVYAAFGMNETAMKVEVVLFFVAALGVMGALCWNALPLPYLLGLVAAIGFHPFLWEWKNMIMSDFPFLFFVLLSLLAYQRAHAAGGRGQKALAWAALAGASACAAILTRMIGVALLPSLLLFDLVRFRRLSRPLLVAACVGGALFGVQALAFSTGEAAEGGQGYGQIVEHNLLGRLSQAVEHVPAAVDRYASFAAVTWSNGYSKAVKRVLFLLFAVPFGAGFLYSVARRLSPRELFSVVYVVALLPWTFGWSRYLIPVLPFYLFYLFVGTWLLQRWAGPRLRLPSGALLALTLLLLGGTYAARYSTEDLRPVRNVIDGAEAQAAFDFVARQTRPGDVLITGKPRTLVLAIERTLIAPHQAEDAELLRFFERVSADYALTGPHDEVASRWLSGLAARHPERLRPVFRSEPGGAFRLYRIAAPPGAER